MEKKELEKELGIILSLAEEFCAKHGVGQLNACVIVNEREVYSSGFSIDADSYVTRRREK